MYPISYLVIPLCILLIIRPEYASLFYPFIWISSVSGILVNVMLLFNSPLRKVFFHLFPYSFSNYHKALRTPFYLSIIVFKIWLIYVWPINLSYEAYYSSFAIIVLYCLHYLWLKSKNIQKIFV